MARESMSDRELVLIALQGLPPIWEKFITTISNNDKFLTFDELIVKCAQEETRMISRGRIQKHEEGVPSTFVAQDKKRKRVRTKSKSAPQSSATSSSHSSSRPSKNKLPVFPTFDEQFIHEVESLQSSGRVRRRTKATREFCVSDFE